MDGFFSKSTLAAIKPTLGIVPFCEKCGLYRHCDSPKMPVSGEGRKKILIVGENPGFQESLEGVQFVGRAGKALEQYLKTLNINMRKDCWLHNAVACRKAGRLKDNIPPTDAEINHCRPLLTRTLKELKPEIVIPLGERAVKSLMGIVWKGEKVGLIGRWVGWKIPEQSMNMWICPNWHPSYIIRQKTEDFGTFPVLEKYFTRYLREAIDLKGTRPWSGEGPPKPKIDVILSSRKAAQEIRGFIERGKMVSWDIETTKLKSDSEDGEIICCSISDGNKTIAYMWENEAIEASIELFKSSIYKLGWNISFESKWIKKKVGCRIKNWLSDGMLCSHIIDNRSNINSLKFQSFVRLGAPSYDSHISPYLKAKGSNTTNRIKEVDINELCKYCGADSFWEYKMNVLLMKEINYPFPEE